MKKANYIISHPPRETIIAEATIMNKKNEIIQEWRGPIFVDNVDNRNEDPFVFSNPCIYSYCHASQLRRNKRHDSFLQKGSIIVFVNGADADKNILTIDTVFIVEDVLQWRHFYKQRQGLAIEYVSVRGTDCSLWGRHFRFPFPPFYAHKNVTHSYEAKLWDREETNYSFLPLNEDGTNISISFSELDTNLYEN